MSNLNLLQNIKILYIEDEPVTRNMVVRFLKSHVGKIILAENGKEGIEKFIQYKPDLVISDLVMPDMSGISMIKKIREKGFKCPVIITSAISDSQTIIETVDLKIERYMIKPINLEKLLEHIRQIALDDVNLAKYIFKDDEEKKELELEIRNIYSKFLKQIVGKGAKSIQVFIHGSEIEILSKDNITIYENTLLNSGVYSTVIDLFRKTAYEKNIKVLENDISTLINRNVKCGSIDIFSKRNFERIILIIE